MADIVDSKTRSRMMSGIRGKNTKPEMIIRKALFKRGFRYRIHYKELPGKPDIVFPKYRAVVFVHGCFWHGHDCHLFKWPKSRADFWKKKIETNRERDIRNREACKKKGWRVLVIWECALRNQSESQVQSLIASIESWIRSGQGNQILIGS